MSACARLRQSLIDYADDKLDTTAFVALWREQGGDLCQQLPAGFRKVLDDLLMRVESMRLFSGDSCSFSRQALIDALAAWLDKAQEKPR